MPSWLLRISQALFSRKKILMIIASVVLAIIYAVFGISPQEIKDAVNDAPVLELPAAPMTPTSVPNGK